MFREHNLVPEVPQAPEARTVDARVMNDGGMVEPIPVESLIVDPMGFRSPMELEHVRIWHAALVRGNQIPFTPNVFKRPDAKYSVLGFTTK
jgi:hypothetical protein